MRPRTFVCNRACTEINERSSRVLMFPVPHFDWFCALVRSTSRLLSAGVLICRSGVVVAVAALPYGVSFQCGAVDTAFLLLLFYGCRALSSAGCH